MLCSRCRSSLLFVAAAQPPLHPQLDTHLARCKPTTFSIIPCFLTHIQTTPGAWETTTLRQCRQVGADLEAEEGIEVDEDEAATTPSAAQALEATKRPAIAMAMERPCDRHSYAICNQNLFAVEQLRAVDQMRAAATTIFVDEATARRKPPFFTSKIKQLEGRVKKAVNVKLPINHQPSSRCPKRADVDGQLVSPRCSF